MDSFDYAAHELSRSWRWGLGVGLVSGFLLGVAVASLVAQAALDHERVTGSIVAEKPSQWVRP